MFNKLFKNKKTKYLNLFLLTLPFLLIIALLGFNIVSSLKNFGGQPEKIVYIEGHDLSLRGNATDCQKDLFDQLVKAYESADDLTIAKALCANFVADFYTWSNKYGSYDVGGIQFLWEDCGANTYWKARDDFYYYLSDYIAEYGAENLLEVIDVSVDGAVKEDGYNASDDEFFETAFSVDVAWNYAEHPHFSNNEYQHDAHFTVIKTPEGKYGIVEGY